jgi:hypothetical protein
MGEGGAAKLRGVGVDFFMTCTENEIRGVSCFGIQREDQDLPNTIANNAILTYRPYSIWRK